MPLISIVQSISIDINKDLRLGNINIIYIVDNIKLNKPLLQRIPAVFWVNFWGHRLSDESREDPDAAGGLQRDRQRSGATASKAIPGGFFGDFDGILLGDFHGIFKQVDGFSLLDLMVICFFFNVIYSDLYGI